MTFSYHTRTLPKPPKTTLKQITGGLAHIYNHRGEYLDEGEKLAILFSLIYLRRALKREERGTK